MQDRTALLSHRHRVARALRRVASSSVGGLSRHSAVPALRQSIQASLAPAQGIGAVAASLAVGCLLIGVAVALLVESRLGLAPYDVFSAGVASSIGLSLGQAGWVIAAVLFAVAALLGHHPRGWSIAYVIGNGIAIDATVGLLATPASVAGRVAFLVAGIVVMALGINFVVHAGVTGGPFELLMAAGEDRGIDRTATRYGLDLSVLALGIAIGGPIGIGTFVYAGSMAVVLGVIRQVLLDHRNGRRARLDGDGDGGNDTVGSEAPASQAMPALPC